MTVSDFPLAKWFDLSKRIKDSDADFCAAQIMLFSWKEGLAPDSITITIKCNLLRSAVKAHNSTFQTKKQATDKVKYLTQRVAVLEERLAKRHGLDKSLLDAKKELAKLQSTTSVFS